MLRTLNLPVRLVREDIREDNYVASKALGDSHREAAYTLSMFEDLQESQKEDVGGKVTLFFGTKQKQDGNDRPK